MTPTLYQYEPQPYVLVKGLQDYAKPSSVRSTEPADSGRQAVLLHKLGEKAMVRVRRFRNCFASAWGENGKALSPRALDAFFRFVEGATFPEGNRSPSVFMTDEGGLELCWEDRNGKSVQVEFTAKAVEFYEGATEEEGSVPFERLAELCGRLAT